MITRSFAESEIRNFLWDVRRLWCGGQKITAVKLMRFLTGFGLVMSKQLTESMVDSRNIEGVLACIRGPDRERHSSPRPRVGHHHNPRQGVQFSEDEAKFLAHAISQAKVDAENAIKEGLEANAKEAARQMAACDAIERFMTWQST